VPLAPSGALRLRLRLRRAPSEPPAPEPASNVTAADDAPFELLGEARGPSSSFISWSSAMEDLSESFAARDVPEDPEHPDGSGPESPAAVPRRAHVTPAGAAQAAAEGMLPLAADDVAGEAAFPFAPQTSDGGIMLAEGGADADVAEAEPGGAGGGYALVSSPALWPSSGPRGGAASEDYEAWEEADAADADGEDERRLYYGADVAMPQEYGSSSEDPYAPSDEDEGKRGRRIEGESSGAEESSGSDFDEEGNLVLKEP
jgi:hypothetical protein